MNIKSAISYACEFLDKIHDNPRLDAEILLAFVTGNSRTYLYTWPERELEKSEEKDFLDLIERRKQGQPVAYLTGTREFWSLNLHVAPGILIPRPETELLVELALEHIGDGPHSIADLGTGSGAIALAIASERPDCQVTATDASEDAILITGENAQRLDVQNIKLATGNWCEPLGDKKFDLIVTNPPYIAENDPHLQQGDVRFEPVNALVSGIYGLDDINILAVQVLEYLNPECPFLLEHGYDQGSKVRQILESNGYNKVNTYKDLNGNDRVSIGFGWGCRDN